MPSITLVMVVVYMIEHCPQLMSYKLPKGSYSRYCFFDGIIDRPSRGIYSTKRAVPHLPFADVMRLWEIMTL